MSKPSVKRNAKATVEQAASPVRPVPDEWAALLARLPAGLDEMARQTGALQRKRAVKSAGDLLRLVLAYSLWDWSLRQVGAWATVTGVVELSDVALRQRLLHTRLWLSQVLGQGLGQVRLARPTTGVRARIFDASVITEPGSTGTDWRLHIGFDVGLGRFDEWEVTDEHGGETLLRHAVEQGDILLVDRAYSHRKGLGYILQAGAQVIARTNGHNLPMKTAREQPLDVRRWLAGLSPRTRTIERAVRIQTPEGEFELRLIAHRLPADAVAAAARRAAKTSRKNGTRLSKLARVMAGWVVVVSNLPAESWSAGDVLALYRVRWQVEILIKRYKSVLQLDHLRAKNAELAQVYLLGKALGALLLDQQTAIETQRVTTWFKDTVRPVSLWRWTSLWFDQLRAAVRGVMTEAMMAARLSKLGRYLRDSPRLRRQQLALVRHWLSHFSGSTPLMGAKIALSPA
ncbi:MAG: IS4 family transposase [Anaerolineales bacterium]